MSFTWQNGRQLATATKNGVTASYLYNANGGRHTKTVDGVTTFYYYIDGVLYAQDKTPVPLPISAGDLFCAKKQGLSSRTAPVFTFSYFASKGTTMPPLSALSIMVSISLMVLAVPSGVLPSMGVSFITLLTKYSISL